MTERNGVEIGTAYVTIMPDGSRIGPEVKKSLGVVDREADIAGKSSGKRFGGAFKFTAGKAIGAAGGIFAATAGKDFLTGAIGQASDLNEAGTKLDAIFGKATKRVEVFASRGAKALGQSRLEVLEAAASFGTFGKAAGLQGPSLARFSTGFAQLATDLASFNNSSPEQAVQAIGAALRGEAEPIRSFGVLLNDATLKEEALRLGLIKTTKEALTPQAKVLAAQAAIYKQTKDAQGDFVRTSDGLANQQRVLSARFADLKGEIGKGFLPVAKDTVGFLNREALPAVEGFIDGFQNRKGAGGDARELFETIRDASQDTAGFVRDIGKAFNNLPDPVKKGALFGAAGLYGAKKTGALGLLGRPGGRAGGGSGLLGLATANKPLPVFVVNPGFGGAGGPGKGKGFGKGGLLPLGPVGAAAGASALIVGGNKKLAPNAGIYGSPTGGPTGGWKANDLKDPFGGFFSDLLGGKAPKALGVLGSIDTAVDGLAGKTSSWRDTIIGTNKQLERLDAQKPSVFVKHNIDGVLGKAKELDRALDDATQERLARLQLAISSKGVNTFGLQARANGGPVTARQPYIVGERGPEVFMPRESGTVLPNHQLGVGGVHFNGDIHVEARDYDDFTRQLRSRASRKAWGGRG